MAPPIRPSVAVPAGTPTLGVRAGGVPTLVVASAAAVGLAASVVGARSDHLSVATGPVLCPFRAVTGLPCPTCGMTRSWVALAEGDLPHSLHLHPVGIVVMALAAWLVARTALHLARREAVPPLERLVPPRVFFAVVSATVVVGCVRIATGIT